MRLLTVNFKTGLFACRAKAEVFLTPVLVSNNPA